jgi:hypothetical protein
MELQQPDLVHTLKTENWKNFIKVAFITHIIKQSCTYHCLWDKGSNKGKYENIILSQTPRKPKTNRRRKIIKIRAEINEIETQKNHTKNQQITIFN